MLLDFSDVLINLKRLFSLHPPYINFQTCDAISATAAALNEFFLTDDDLTFGPLNGCLPHSFVCSVIALSSKVETLNVCVRSDFLIVACSRIYIH